MLFRSAVPGSARPVYSAPRTAPPEADVDAQLAVLRSERNAGGGAPGHPAAPGSEEATQLGLETLQRAIRLKQRVVMNVVDGMGNAVRETVVPVAVNGGRVRGLGPGPATRKVLCQPRVNDLVPAEEN